MRHLTTTLIALSTTFISAQELGPLSYSLPSYTEDWQIASWSQGIFFGGGTHITSYSASLSANTHPESLFTRQPPIGLDEASLRSWLSASFPNEAQEVAGESGPLSFYQWACDSASGFATEMSTIYSQKELAYAPPHSDRESFTISLSSFPSDSLITSAMLREAVVDASDEEEISDENIVIAPLYVTTNSTLFYWTVLNEDGSYEYGLSRLFTGEEAPTLTYKTRDYSLFEKHVSDWQQALEAAELNQKTI